MCSVKRRLASPFFGASTSLIGQVGGCASRAGSPLFPGPCASIVTRAIVV
jgi:hypothetical protein